MDFFILIHQIILIASYTYVCIESILTCVLLLRNSKDYLTVQLVFPLKK